MEPDVDSRTRTVHQINIRGLRAAGMNYSCDLVPLNQRTLKANRLWVLCDW
jgi:hypothetical protein